MSEYSVNMEAKAKQQYVFDITVRKLAEQGCAGYSDEGCSYRGNHNTKCAVGMWIPDSAYTPEMEDIALRVLRVKFKNVLPEILLDEELFGIFDALQIVHDKLAWTNSTDAFHEAFGAIAKQYEFLNLDVLNSLELHAPVTT